EAEMKQENASLVIIDYSKKQYGSAVVRLLRERLGFAHATLASPATTQAASAPQLTQSFIVDYTHRNKPWTLDELLKKLPLQLESRETVAEIFGILDTQADFTLVIGDDFEVLFDYTEDSREDFEKSNQDMEYQQLIEDIQ
ncbi:MAG: hypothetical protein L0287_30380, partial [Anaerolineae bacterium]|nr:hypothetical protein [Anaerolineae bacterium]